MRGVIPSNIDDYIKNLSDDLNKLYTKLFNMDLGDDGYEETNSIIDNGDHISLIKEFKKKYQKTDIKYVMSNTISISSKAIKEVSLLSNDINNEKQKCENFVHKIKNHKVDRSWDKDYKRYIKNSIHLYESIIDISEYANNIVKEIQKYEKE